MWLLSPERLWHKECWKWKRQGEQIPSFRVTWERGLWLPLKMIQRPYGSHFACIWHELGKDEHPKLRTSWKKAWTTIPEAECFRRALYLGWMKKGICNITCPVSKLPCKVMITNGYEESQSECQTRPKIEVKWFHNDLLNLSHSFSIKGCQSLISTKKYIDFFFPKLLKAVSAVAIVHTYMVVMLRILACGVLVSGFKSFRPASVSFPIKTAWDFQPWGSWMSTWCAFWARRTRAQLHVELNSEQSTSYTIAPHTADNEKLESRLEYEWVGSSQFVEVELWGQTVSVVDISVPHSQAHTIYTLASRWSVCTLLMYNAQCNKVSDAH